MQTKWFLMYSPLSPGRTTARNSASISTSWCPLPKGCASRLLVAWIFSWPRKMLASKFAQVATTRISSLRACLQVFFCHPAIKSLFYISRCMHRSVPKRLFVQSGPGNSLFTHDNFKVRFFKNFEVIFFAERERMDNLRVLNQSLIAWPGHQSESLLQLPRWASSVLFISIFIFSIFPGQSCASVACLNGGISYYDGTQCLCSCPLGYSGSTCGVALGMLCLRLHVLQLHVLNNVFSQMWCPSLSNPRPSLNFVKVSFTHNTTAHAETWQQDIYGFVMFIYIEISKFFLRHTLCWFTGRGR